MNTCSTDSSITVNKALRGIAGTLLVISLLLTEYHSKNWIFFSGFIGLNLLQSSFTNWCPMMTILRRVCKLKD